MLLAPVDICTHMQAPTNIYTHKQIIENKIKPTRMGEASVRLVPPFPPPPPAIPWPRGLNFLYFREPYIGGPSYSNQRGK